MWSLSSRQGVRLGGQGFGSLAEYLAMRFEAGHSRAVAAVRFYAKLGGQASPAGPATERVLAGFRRKDGPVNLLGV